MMISSTTIDEQFNPTKRDAQGLLPHLVSRLVSATVEPGAIKHLRIPTLDAIGRPGYDGVLEISTGNRYVPDGVSVWEMGVGSDPQAKANGDYLKRCRESLGIATNTATFVFVTPHRWDGKDNWATEKRQERIWRDVRVLDNVDVEGWLELAPAIGRWLAARWGIPFAGMRDLELWEGEFNSKYDATISPSLVIGGRSEVLEQVQKWFGEASPEIRIEGETLEEVFAFVAAAVRKLPSNEVASVASRLLYIEEPNALDAVSALALPHFAIAMTPEVRHRARALKQSSVRLIAPVVRSTMVQSVSESMAQLGRMGRKAITEALVEMRVSTQQADRIAQGSRGSFTGLMLLVAQQHDSLPLWATDGNSLDLLPLMLAGQWTGDSEGDKNAIAQLAAKPYDQIERVMHRWTAPAGPIIRRGPIWDWVALDFAWSVLGRQMERIVVDRFRDVCKAVLAIPDPRFDLPPENRWAAAIYGKTHPYSVALRTGLVGSIAELATHKEAVLRGAGQSIADAIVRDLLSVDGRANLPAWLSLCSFLSDLAEASPESFLSSIDLLLSDEAAARSIFSEDGGFFASSPHVYLLWALERLAWHRDYLTRVTLVLGRLELLDPGGNTMNRPANSLAGIFRPWLPGTTASADDRLAAIDLLYKRYPTAGWHLAIALLPDHGMHSCTASPQWRDWRPEDPYKVTNAEYWAMLEPVIRRLLSWAGSDADHWVSVLKAYEDIRGKHPELENDVLKAILELSPSILDRAGRENLAEQVRKLLVRHKQFHSEQWAMTEEQLQPFDKLYQALAPESLADRYVWLFTAWPDLPRDMDDDYEKRQAKLAKLRSDAIRDILDKDGLPGVAALAEKAAVANVVGGILAELGLPERAEGELLVTWLALTPTRENIPPLLAAALGYVGISYARRGNTWLDAILATYGDRFSANALANIGWALPATSATWDRIDSWGGTAAEMYWMRTPFVHLPSPETDLVRALRRLLAANRPYRAMDLAAMHVQTGSGERPVAGQHIAVPNDLLIAILQGAAASDPGAEWYGPKVDDSLAYHVSGLLDVLEEQGTDQEQLARLEWQWLPALERGGRHGMRGLKTLEQILSSEPSWFVDVLKLVFRGEGEEPREASPEDSARASHAYHLLHEFRKIPGLIEMSPATQAGNGNVTFPIGRVDQTRLAQWINEARRIAREANRLYVCDERIGELLAHSPCDPNGDWPCEGVRAVIEGLQSDAIDSGLQLGVFNSRGTICRSARGGDPERELAVKFRERAARLMGKSPRIGAVLKRMADGYELDAKREDERAELEEFK